MITTPAREQGQRMSRAQAIPGRLWHLVGETLQHLYMIFFRPTAWARTLTQIDPRLSSQFTLADVPAAVQRHPALRRLLVEGYVLLPLLMGLILTVVGVPAPGIVYALTLALTVSVPLGFSIGFAGSLGVLICISLLAGLNQQVVAFVSPDVMGVAAGLSGALILHLAPHHSTWTAVRQVGRGLMGILVVGVVIGAAFGLLALLTGSSQGGMRSVELAATGILDPLKLPFLVSYSLAWGIALTIGAFVPTMMAVGWHTRNWREGLRVGALVGLFFGATQTVISLLSGHAINGELLPQLDNPITRGSTGVATGVLFAWYVTILYVLGDIFGGRVAAGVAAALGGIGWDAFWLVAGIGTVLDIARISVGTILGLTFYWWWPGLVWPMQAIYGYIVYIHAQSQLQPEIAAAASAAVGGPGPARALRRHPAFQDETQFLPLPALDSYLVLVAERDPPAGQAAFAELAVGSQRWAVQAAQIELDARQLDRCTALDAIAQAHRALNATDIAEPGTPLLRSFARRSQDVAAAIRQHSSYNQRLALRDVEEHLEQQIHELYRTTDRYAVRFLPIALRWQRILAQQIEALTATAELRQEIDNPYIISVPITTEQEIFVGRADISLRIEQFLADPRNAPILLYGQRRMGKTSLLHNLGRLLPSTIIPIFIDLQGAASQARDHAGFLYSLATDLISAARQSRAGIVLPPLAYEILQQDPFLFFDHWLNAVEDHLGPNRILLELDEFETLDHALVEGRFSEQAVLGMLRHLIQHRPRFKVLLSGSHTLDELHRWASYMVNLQVVKISYLREEETRMLIEAPIAGFPLRYDPVASARICSLTHGYPLLVQLLCSEMVALKNEQPPAQRRWATLADVEQAAQRALLTGSMVFADIAFNQIDKVGEAVLREMAAQGEGSVVGWDMLVARLPEAKPPTLTRLLRRDLLEPVDGGYRFQVELIRRWFAGETGAERVREGEAPVFLPRPAPLAIGDAATVKIAEDLSGPLSETATSTHPATPESLPPITHPRMLLNDYVRWLGVGFFVLLGIVGIAGVIYSSVGPKPRFVEGWPVLFAPGWALALYEVNDSNDYIEAKLNGTSFEKDSATVVKERGMAEIKTPAFRVGEDNRLDITVYNDRDGYSWGIALAHSGKIVWVDEEGRRGIQGARNNDRSQEHQIVHQILLILHPDGSVTSSVMK